MREENRRKELIQKLSLYLGLEEEDITEDDSLQEELHMSPSDVYDFLTTNELSSDPESLDLANVESVSDLVDAILEEVQVE